MTETLSLADIGEIDMDDVEEYRFTLLPVGAYTFQVEEAGLNVQAITSDDELEEIPISEVKVKVMDTHGLTGLEKGVEESTFIGETHVEKFFLRERRDVGRVKAFLLDSNFTAKGKLVALLAQYKGHVFQGRIKHRASKNDKSMKYANIALDRVKAQKTA